MLVHNQDLLGPVLKQESLRMETHIFFKTLYNFFHLVLRAFQYQMTEFLQVATDLETFVPNRIHVEIL